jgi:hypothetical protein
MISAGSSMVSAPPARPGESVKQLLPWLVAVAFFMESLDTTILNTAVPTIASTMQQMAISFGIATASLATAGFIPDRFHTSAPEVIQGIHKAFLALGGLTVLSSFVFRELKNNDGNTVSLHRGLQPVA